MPIKSEHLKISKDIVIVNWAKQVVGWRFLLYYLVYTRQRQTSKAHPICR